MLFINCVVCLCICPSVEVSILSFRTSTWSRFWVSGPRRTDEQDLSVYFKQCCRGLIPGSFFFLFFFRPFPASCPGLIPRFFCFFFSPFSNGFAVYGKTGLCIFQMALPRVNTRVLLLLLFFPPLIDGPTQAITFLK